MSWLCSFTRYNASKSNSNTLPNAAPLRDISFQTLIWLPIYAFLLMFNNNIWLSKSLKAKCDLVTCLSIYDLYSSRLFCIYCFFFQVGPWDRKDVSSTWLKRSLKTALGETCPGAPTYFQWRHYIVLLLCGPFLCRHVPMFIIIK